MSKSYLLIAFAVFFNCAINAQESQFKAGETIVAYGKIATVSGMQPLPEKTQFKVSFDLARAAKPGEINRSIDSLARFINMHTANDVAVKDIKLAAVIHGSAVKDFVNHTKYQTMTAKTDEKRENKNADLIKALSEQGVEFYICGQSAAYHGVKTADLLTGVNMALSAMTAHALLQQKGYTLNPF